MHSHRARTSSHIRQEPGDHHSRSIRPTVPPSFSSPVTVNARDDMALRGPRGLHEGALSQSSCTLLFYRNITFAFTLFFITFFKYTIGKLLFFTYQSMTSRNHTHARTHAHIRKHAYIALFRPLFFAPLYISRHVCDLVRSGTSVDDWMNLRMICRYKWTERIDEE